MTGQTKPYSRRGRDARGVKGRGASWPQRQTAVRPPGGLTLVEVLVVVAVIGLLVAIMLPALSHVQAEGRSTQCLSNLRQIAGAFHMYAGDHDGLLPDDDSEFTWDELLREHLPASSLYVCPVDAIARTYPIGLSYAWRDTFSVDLPASSLAGRNLRQAGPGDLILVFEALPGHHQPDMINGAVLDTSVHRFTTDRLEADLERPVR